MNVNKDIAVAATSKLLEIVDRLNFVGVLTNEESENFYSLITLIRTYLFEEEQNV